MHENSSEVQGSGSFSINLADRDIVTTIEKKYGEDALVPLCCTVHDTLFTFCLLIAISLEVKHQDFYHVSIACGSCKMDRLRTHVFVSMECHLLLRRDVILELVPQVIKNDVSFFKANELQQVHVIVEPHVQALFTRQPKVTKGLDIISLNEVLYL